MVMYEIVLCLHTLQEQALCLAQFLAHRWRMNEWKVSTHLISFQPYINSLNAPAAGMTIYILETTRIPKFREAASLSRPSSTWWGRHFRRDLLTPHPVFLSSTLLCPLTHQPHPPVDPDGNILEKLSSLGPSIWACHLLAWYHILNAEGPLSTLIHWVMSYLLADNSLTCWWQGKSKHVQLHRPQEASGREGSQSWGLKRVRSVLLAGEWDGEAWYSASMF